MSSTGNDVEMLPQFLLCLPVYGINLLLFVSFRFDFVFFFELFLFSVTDWYLVDYTFTFSS